MLKVFFLFFFFFLAFFLGIAYISPFWVQMVIFLQHEDFCYVSSIRKISLHSPEAICMKEVFIADFDSLLHSYKNSDK